MGLETEFRGLIQALEFDGAPRVQREEMRRAFYCGALIALGAVGESRDRAIWADLTREALRELEATVDRDYFRGKFDDEREANSRPTGGGE